MIDGLLSMQGKFSGMRMVVRSRGRLEASRNFKAERLSLYGAAYCGGTFRGESLDILSCERSEIARVLVSEVNVKYKPRGDVPEIRDGEFLLSSYLIEAQSVSLEHVSADTVECDSAVIGPGCRIGELVYKNSVEIDEHSVVERLYKI